MDTELLMALIFLWFSTTMALVIFLSMWFRNRGESFHPHSIEVDARHSMFLVVGGRTRCKPSFVVKSISAFVAPRGSSSNKHFTALIIVMSVAGMFGTLRWNAIEDASFEESRLAFIGFGALILTAAFETDVSNGRFMEDKLMVTAWLIHKLQLAPLLPFPLHANSLPFRLFLRQSKLYPHYEEEDRMYVRAGDHTIHDVFPYLPWWSALHTLGALVYVSAVPTAVIWNDEYPGSHLAALLTWAAFLIFCGGGYLTGTYLPVVEPLQCIVLQWNPFLQCSDFLEQLHEAVEEHSRRLHDSSKESADSMSTFGVAETVIKRGGGESEDEDDEDDHDHGRHGDGDCDAEGSPLDCAGADTSSSSSTSSSTSSVSSTPRAGQMAGGSEGLRFTREQVAAKVALVLKNNACLRLAHRHPKRYLQLVGHLMVMFEMVAVLLPSIAMGISWMTALCPDTPASALLDLLRAAVLCFFTGKGCDLNSHCILR